MNKIKKKFAKLRLNLNNMENKFCWNEDTLEYFKNLSSRATKSRVQKEVLEFVEYDCHLEDGETYEMLANDLINQVYNTNTNT